MEIPPKTSFIGIKEMLSGNGFIYSKWTNNTDLHFANKNNRTYSKDI